MLTIKAIFHCFYKLSFVWIYRQEILWRNEVLTIEIHKIKFQIISRCTNNTQSTIQNIHTFRFPSKWKHKFSLSNRFLCRPTLTTPSLLRQHHAIWKSPTYLESMILKLSKRSLERWRPSITTQYTITLKWVFEKEKAS